MYVCIYMHTYTHIYRYIYTNTNAHVRVRVYIHTYIRYTDINIGEPIIEIQMDIRNHIHMCNLYTCVYI